jgi:CRISPR-associated protein Cmr2
MHFSQLPEGYPRTWHAIKPNNRTPSCSPFSIFRLPSSVFRFLLPAVSVSANNPTSADVLRIARRREEGEDRVMNMWQRKLLAFLHDPPHKALDIAGHRARAAVFLRAAFPGKDAAIDFEHAADWTAAAADRFPFPHYRPSGVKAEPGDFRHPMGGSTLCLPGWPTADGAEKILQACQPHDFTDLPEGPERERAAFFATWRRWPVEAAKMNEHCAHLPADTRIPDHSIWLHNSITSALQGCIQEGATEPTPAFLVFQLGPVQEFIAQARSTRDLWSGSFLLSWLMAHALKALAWEVGPDAILFPFLRGQVLFDWLNKDFYGKIRYGEDSLWDRLKVDPRSALIPNLPNRFFAIVPALDSKRIAEAAERALRKEWEHMGNSVWKWLVERGMESEYAAQFHAQIAAFPQVAWHAEPWPMGDESRLVADLLAWGREHHAGSADNLSELHKLAVNKIPEDHRDKRIYTGDLQALRNPAFAWSILFDKTERMLAARRNLRDFQAWNGNNASKDTFSGKEEIIGKAEGGWWENVRQHPEKAVRALFRSGDRMGAANLVKRVWHEAHLPACGFTPKQLRAALRFESVPSVAASCWREEVREKLVSGLRSSAHEVIFNACSAISAAAREWGVEVESFDEHRADAWIRSVDPEVFEPSFWKEGKDEQTEVRGALAALYRRKEDTGVAEPPKYVAVLAFDGDDMGKWVSGDKAPPLLGQLAKSAASYFQNLGATETQPRRPLSPSYHLQFSEALANFAVYLARPAVEHFGGQLIYAGGDDVLAMVPAAQGVACAESLRNAFRGQVGLTGVFSCEGCNGGFARLAHPKDEEPCHPLVVPGPRADASIGIAVGHIHSPLQGLVRAAQQAEKDAKKLRAKDALNRCGALAIRVMKRSGETRTWGARWELNALPLYRGYVAAVFGDKPLFSRKLGYAFAALVEPYYRQGFANISDFPEDEVIRLELARVLKQQRVDKDEVRDKEVDAFRASCAAYLKSLPEEKGKHLVDLMAAAHFIHRGDEA